MKQFADLVIKLGTSTKTNEKLGALSEYFSIANDKDKVWVIAIFSGRRPKRAVNSTQLWTWCNELAKLPDWLFEECYHAVGDLGETIALLLPEMTIADARPNGSSGHSSRPDRIPARSTPAIGISGATCSEAGACRTRIAC